MAARPLFEQVSGNVYGNHEVFVGFQLFNLLEFNNFVKLGTDQRSLCSDLKGECGFQLREPAGTNLNQWTGQFGEDRIIHGEFIPECELLNRIFEPGAVVLPTKK